MEGMRAILAGRIRQAWVEQKEYVRKQRRIPNIFSKHLQSLLVGTGDTGTNRVCGPVLKKLIDR